MNAWYIALLVGVFLAVCGPFIIGAFLGVLMLWACMLELLDICPAWLSRILYGREAA